MTRDTKFVEDKAAAPDSDFALVRLFAPESLRPHLTALHALYNELMNVAYTVSDPAVATAKLGWWREEIGHAFEGHVRHPILEALADSIGAGRLKREELQDLALGALENVDPEGFSHDVALDEFCARTGGLRARSEARLAGVAGAGLDAAHRVGTACAHAMLLHLLPRDLPRGRLFIPQNALARHQVTRARLQQGAREAGSDALVRERAERTDRMLAESAEALPAPDAGALRHLLAQAALDRARVRRIRRAGARALSREPSYGSLGRLLTAWRAAGRAQRRYLSS